MTPSNDLHSARPGLIAASLIGTLPPVGCLLLKVGAPVTMLWGALVWAIAVALKTVAAGLLQWRLAERLTTRTMAAIQGLVSTVCELGTAALWFVSQKPIAFEEALLFGIGAGSFETLAVVAYAAWRQARGTEESEDLIEEWRENAPRSFWVRYHLAIERLAALLGHVGARGLVALGVSSASLAQGLVLMLLPVTTFSTVDGVASFGMARGWRWLDPRVARRFYSFVLLVGTLELALFVALANA